MRKFVVPLVVVSLFLSFPVDAQRAQSRTYDVELKIIARGFEKSLQHCFMQELTSINDVRITAKDPDYIFSVFGIPISTTASASQLGYTVHISILHPVPARVILEASLAKERKKVERLINDTHRIIYQKMAFDTPENLGTICKGIVEDFDKKILQPLRDRAKRKGLPEVKTYYGN